MQRDHDKQGFRRNGAIWLGGIVAFIVLGGLFHRFQAHAPAEETAAEGGGSSASGHGSATPAGDSGAAAGQSGGEQSGGDTSGTATGQAHPRPPAHSSSAKVVATAPFGSGVHQLGLNEETAPTGPAALVPMGPNEALVVDQFNDRIARMSDGSVSTAFSLKGLFVTDAIRMPNGDLLLLDAYQTRTVVRVSAEGSEIARWAVALPGDEPRRLFTNQAGEIFVGGLDDNFRLSTDGAITPVPGVPSYANPGEFLKTRRVAEQQFQLVVVDAQGQVLHQLDLHRPFDAIQDVGSDASGLVYIMFERVDGDSEDAAATVAVEVYNVNSQNRVKELVFDFVGYAEVEHYLVVTPEGEIWRLTSSETSMSLVRESPKEVGA